MRGFDSWLERPYTDAAERGDAYDAWCEENDLDPSEDHWDAFDTHCDEEREDAQMAAAEAAAEARADALRDGDW